MRPPPQIVRLAEAQLGLIARWQLLERIAEQAADGVLRSGWCEPIYRGVHRIVGGARLPEQVAIAATLRCGRDATLTGPVALRLMDVDGIRGDDPYLVLLPPDRRCRQVDFPVSTDPDPDRPVATWGEVRVAGPVDALIDSARFLDRLGERRLRLAHDVLRWRGLLTAGRLTERIREFGRSLPDCPGRDLLLDLDATPAAGDGERELGRLLSRFDPAPEPQVWVTPRRRVDWYFRSVRYGYEYQGSVDHGTIAARQRDDDRDTELRREGIRLGYLVAGDLADEPALLSTVAGTLSVRAHELGVTPPVLRPR